MRGRPLEFALVVGAALALVLLAIGKQAALSGHPPSVYSSYDTGANGFRALYEVVRAAGLPVSRLERPVGLLDPSAGTLVLSTNALDSSSDNPNVRVGTYDQGDVDALKRFVSGGGRLVDLDDGFAGKNDIVPGVGLGADVPVTYRAIPLARDAFTTGVTAVAGRISSVFDFKDAKGLPLLASDRGIVAMRYKVGKGEVVAITAPALFSNLQIAKADNARFAYNVLSGHGPIVFDEYAHGYDDNLSFWQVLPWPVRAAVWIVTAIVLLALIGANVPFAPPVPLDAPDERDSSAYIDSMAALMRRARAARAAIGAFAADAARLRQTSEGEARAVEQLERLHAIPNPSEAALVTAAVLDYRLRKDLV